MCCRDELVVDQIALEHVLEGAGEEGDVTAGRDQELSSANFVPKSALSGIDGIQYRSMPGSRIVLTVTMRVPAALA